MNNRLGKLLGSMFMAIGLCTAALTAQAQDNSEYVLVDPPLKTSNPEKIEVLEFFSYACNHCNDLNPLIKDWASKLPADVVFKRIPIGGRGFYALMANGYYALESFGAVEKMDDEVFKAIHSKNRPEFNDPKSLAKWVAKKGVTTEESFLNAFNSFSIDSKVKQGDLLFDQSGATGVPSIVVDGKYRMTGNNAGSFAGLLSQTEKVIAMRRAERKKK